MRNTQLFSRRDVDRKVDFRPTDLDPQSPSTQLRRLQSHLSAAPELATGDDILDCPDAMAYLREYAYRKIFTGTSHEDFLALDASDPEAIDWLIAVHEAESIAFQQSRSKR